MPNYFFLIVGGVTAAFLVLVISLAWAAYQTSDLKSDRDHTYY
jgi:hypothetical protein